MPFQVYSRLGFRVKRDLFKVLEEEGVVFDSGYCWVTFAAKRLKGKGFTYYGLRRLSRGRFILTNKRLVAMIGGFKLIDVPRDHEYFNLLSFDRRQEKRYEIIVDYDGFSQEVSGKAILSYHIHSSQVYDF